MSIFINILILFAFLAEVILLARLERIIWGTLYTPLNALAIPFTVILFIVICLPKSMGFVEFYYPSLLIWMAGLLLMAIPSWLLGYGYRKRFGDTTLTLAPLQNERFFLIACLVLIVPFLFRIRTLSINSLDLLGSDEFANNFAMFGVWGHLLIFLIACSIVCFACVRKGNRLWPIVIIIMIAGLTFVNQVKSWVLIPIIAGLFLCLVTQRLHMKLKLVLGIVIGGLTVFVGSYLLLFLYAQGYEYDEKMGEYLKEHIFHYLCSGTLGMSEDIRMGIIEEPDLDMLFAPFVNMGHFLTGEELVSPINVSYIEISANNALVDNIRTYFGTIYINCSAWQFSIIVMLFGFLFYFVRIIALRTQKIFTIAIDAWFCALLVMGWFDFYFGLTTCYEVPLYLLLMYCIEKLVYKSTYDEHYPAQL